MNDFISIVYKDLKSIVDSLFELSIIDNSFNKKNISIDFFSKSKRGDVSTNLFILLNRYLIDNNFDLKKYLTQEINKLNYVNKIEIVKIGFINIYLEIHFIVNKLNSVIQEKEKYGQIILKKNNKVNIEFVSANPTGPINVAHMRGAVYGDVLSNILKKIGYVITKEYYINDSGSQITILGNSLYKRYQQLRGKKIQFNQDEYPGDYLIEIARIISSNYKDKWLTESSRERIKFFEEFAIKEIIVLIINDLKKMNIRFNKFTYESTIEKENTIQKVIKILKENNLLYEGILKKPEGKDLYDWEPREQLLYKSTKFNDESDRSLKKANGQWTYFANDIAYHFDKISRNYDQLINIWGADHIGYINRMKSVVDVLSNKNNFLEIKICQIVRLLKDGVILKMSKREGNFVTLNEIVNIVGNDSIRYYMISTKNETPIDFDIKKVIEKNKDNPVFYCQYAYARASSVINKAIKIKEFNHFNKLFKKFDNKYISNYEKEIILKIISWPYVLLQSANLKQPHRITNYIEDLSSDFHSLWNRGKEDKSLRFLDFSNQNKTITKLLWIESMRIVLRSAFQIIGIKAFEKM